MVLVLKPAKGTGGRRRRDRRSLRIEFVNFNASCCCKFGYKAVTRIVFTENLMIIPATKANYKDDIKNGHYTAHRAVVRSVSSYK